MMKIKCTLKAVKVELNKVEINKEENTMILVEVTSELSSKDADRNKNGMKIISGKSTYAGIRELWPSL